MDILDHLLEHDAKSTRRLLTLCRDLPGDQWQKPFEFGQGSLYDTFDHLIDSAEYWTSLMQGQPGPFVPAPLDTKRGVESLLSRFDAVSPVFMAIARQKRDEGRLDDMFTDIETGPARRTFGACIVHVTTHSMHHRAQVQVMFDQTGTDYNPFGGSALDGYPIEE